MGCDEPTSVLDGEGEPALWRVQYDRPIPNIEDLEEDEALVVLSAFLICGVCGKHKDKSILAESILANCKECGVSVHPGCYSLEATGDGWQCRKCAAGGAGAVCPLCPAVDKWVLSKTEDGTWAHDACANCHKETHFKGNTYPHFFESAHR